MTLQELAALVEEDRREPVILIDPDEWQDLVGSVESWSIVPATEDRPAFFWFHDKKIVTPAYVKWAGVGWEPAHARRG